MIANRKWYERPLEHIKTWEDKIWTLTTHVGKFSNGMKLVSVVDGEVRIKQATKQWYIVAKEWDGISLSSDHSSSSRSWIGEWKANTIVCSGESCVYDWTIRRLTPIECERLQTLPDDYTAWVSDSQRYKQLGNGRTVDVIAHIFSFMESHSH